LVRPFWAPTFASPISTFFRASLKKCVTCLAKRQPQAFRQVCYLCCSSSSRKDARKQVVGAFAGKWWRPQFMIPTGVDGSGGCLTRGFPTSALNHSVCSQNFFQRTPIEGSLLSINSFTLISGTSRSAAQLFSLAFGSPPRIQSVDGPLCILRNTDSSLFLSRQPDGAYWGNPMTIMTIFYNYLSSPDGYIFSKLPHVIPGREDNHPFIYHSSCLVGVPFLSCRAGAQPRGVDFNDKFADFLRPRSWSCPKPPYPPGTDF